MLKAHFDAVEKALLETSKIPASAGHPIHKGAAREAFVESFLNKHLSKRVAMCTGEIIDCTSKVGEKRNQLDLILYKPEYPRLNFGGEKYAVLAESVVCTMEVKSNLTKKELEQAVGSARNLKKLSRNVRTVINTGYQPPSILSFVVAYNGPAAMETVHGWIRQLHDANGIAYPDMGKTLSERVMVPSPSVDGIFVLGKGFVVFDNCPLSFASDELRAKNPDMTWVIANEPCGSLLYLFLILTSAVSGFSASWLNPFPYLTEFKVKKLVIAR